MTDLGDSWRKANEQLRHLADCIAGSPVHPAHIALDHLTAVAEELKRTETLLRETQALPGKGSALDGSLQQYRSCLKRLLEVLPGLQAQLLAERSRLEPEREHLQAAAAWAETTKAALK